MTKKRGGQGSFGTLLGVEFLVDGDNRGCLGGGRDEKRNWAGSGGQEPYPYLRVRLAPSNLKTTSAA